MRTITHHGGEAEVALEDIDIANAYYIKDMWELLRLPMEIRRGYKKNGLRLVYDPDEVGLEDYKRRVAQGELDDVDL